jgi:hypothetical protein
MDDLKEQSIFVKFYFKLRKTASEMYEMSKTASGDNAMGRTQTSEVGQSGQTSRAYW